MSHTPGPWKMTHIAGCDWAGVVAGTECIASTVAPDNGDIEVLLANTRLIAAAPELLEACEFARKAVCCDDRYLAVKDVLDAAIAKAKEGNANA